MISSDPYLQRTTYRAEPDPGPGGRAMTWSVWRYATGLEPRLISRHWDEDSARRAARLARDRDPAAWSHLEGSPHG